MTHMIFPSILSADFGNLQKVCEMVNISQADGFHLDVMDGIFVPNISLGFPVIEAVHKYGKKSIDVHLMIVNPDSYLERFKKAGATILTVHAEACPQLRGTVEAIKNLKMKACVAINPLTPVTILTDIILEIDQVCIMGVNPGFGGQTFIEKTFDKVAQLKEMIRTKKSKTLIKVDGGIDLTNYVKLINKGADILVVGTSIFKAKNPVAAIQTFKNMR